MGNGLRRFLDRELRKGPPNPRRRSSLIIGPAARPVVAALAARRDPSFRKLLAGSIRDWQRSLARGAAADLMVGTAGALLACCELERLAPGKAPAAAVKRLRVEVQETASRQLGLLRQGQPVLLGLAHGLAGYLLALEAAQAVFGRSLAASGPPALLEAIAGERLECPGGAALWPQASGSANVDKAGWCHGGPGIGLACLAGFALTGKKAYWQLARMALEGMVRYPNRAGTFCCGSTGRAQILIEAYRVTGNRAWLKKAVGAAGQKEPALQRRWARGFHRGRLGRLYLERRLADPSLPLPGLGPLSVSP